MKIHLLLPAALLFSFTSVNADEYRAPKFKFNESFNNSSKSYAPKEAKWENHYKVQDSAGPERSLASSAEDKEKKKKRKKKKASRSTSSKIKHQKSKSLKDVPNLEVWPFNPED